MAERWKSHTINFRASRFQISLGSMPSDPLGERGLAAPLVVTAPYYIFSGRLQLMLLKLLPGGGGGVGRTRRLVLTLR